MTEQQDQATRVVQAWRGSMLAIIRRAPRQIREAQDRLADARNRFEHAQKVHQAAVDARRAVATRSDELEAELKDARDRLAAIRGEALLAGKEPDEKLETSLVVQASRLESAIAYLRTTKHDELVAAEMRSLGPRDAALTEIDVAEATIANLRPLVSGDEMQRYDTAVRRRQLAAELAGSER